jgi:hypothetical protein
MNNKAPVRVVRARLRARAYVYYMLAFIALLIALLLFFDAGRWAGRVSDAVIMRQYAESVFAMVIANMFVMGAMRG